MDITVTAPAPPTANTIWISVMLIPTIIVGLGYLITSALWQQEIIERKATGRIASLVVAGLFAIGSIMNIQQDTRTAFGSIDAQITRHIDGTVVRRDGDLSSIAYTVNSGHDTFTCRVTSLDLPREKNMAHDSQLVRTMRLSGDNPRCTAKH